MSNRLTGKLFETPQENQNQDPVMDKYGVGNFVAPAGLKAVHIEQGKMHNFLAKLLINQAAAKKEHPIVLLREFFDEQEPPTTVISRCMVELAKIEATLPAPFGKDNDGKPLAIVELLKMSPEKTKGCPCAFCRAIRIATKMVESNLTENNAVLALMDEDIAQQEGNRNFGIADSIRASKETFEKFIAEGKIEEPTFFEPVLPAAKLEIVDPSAPVPSAETPAPEPPTNVPLSPEEAAEEADRRAEEEDGEEPQQVQA